jgi:hypothetical protein
MSSHSPIHSVQDGGQRQAAFVWVRAPSEMKIKYGIAPGP